MGEKLTGKKVAIVATTGFEQSELLEPRKALEAEGAETSIVSLKEGQIKGWKDNDWGDSVDVDIVIGDANPDDFDALVLPGGVMSPDKLRLEPKVVAFVKSFVDAGKPIAAICHGPWILIDAQGTMGRKMTSWPSIRLDLRNAGAEVLDAEVIVDRGLVTSRKPEDLPAFNRKMIEEIAEGPHAKRSGRAA